VTPPLSVKGEFLGGRAEAQLEESLDPGLTRSLILRFAPSASRPGVYPVLLLLEYPRAGPGPVLKISQRAYLLVALGENAEPAVRIEVAPLRIDYTGRLRVGLRSTDGSPHRIRLRVLTPRGLRAEGVAQVEVPAREEAATHVSLVRLDAPRSTRHGILVVAEATDGPLQRTSVATSYVDIASDPALLPRLRGSLLLVSLMLIGGALLFEVHRRWMRERA